MGDPLVAVVPRPLKPTMAEREAHEAAGHVQFRAWCGDCAGERGRNADHRRLDAERAHPTLVLREHEGRWKISLAVTSKEAGEAWIIESVAEAAGYAGVRHFTFKTSIVDLKSEVIESSGETYKVFKEKSQVEEHQANGTTERAVQLVDGIVRTLKTGGRRPGQDADEPRDNHAHRLRWRSAQPVWGGSGESHGV